MSVWTVAAVVVFAGPLGMWLSSRLASAAAAARAKELNQLEAVDWGIDTAHAER